MVMKTKKRKRGTRRHGQNSYHGARKARKGSGHKGGVGMAGTGKRADHKKSLVIKLYGNKYFGKQGITSKKTERIKSRFINLRDIEKNFDSLMKKFGENNELVLSEYKVLGTGEIKSKITIKAKEFSKSAEEKITKAGGKAITLSRKSEDKNIDKGKKVEEKKEDILKNRDNKEKPKK